MNRNKHENTNIPLSMHKKYMQQAIDEAYFGMRNNKGGPFGAIIVLEGVVIGKGFNEVIATKDPTAHAEVLAIRRACGETNQFHLRNAILYTVCEPCPMCIGAIYWANIKKIYYCLDSNDASKIGFDDKHIYNELAKPINDRAIKMTKISLAPGLNLFHEWAVKKNKVLY